MGGTGGIGGTGIGGGGGIGTGGGIIGGGIPGTPGPGPVLEENKDIQREERQ